MQLWRRTGSVAGRASGGSTSPLDELAEFPLGPPTLDVEQRDVTLDEFVAAMSKGICSD
jgi:hypothetical protein